MKKIQAFLIVTLLFFPLNPFFSKMVLSQETTTSNLSTIPLNERFTNEKTKLGPGVFFNYTTINSEWFFWKILTETPNKTYVVVIINQTKENRLTDFIQVPKDDALTYRLFLWTNPKSLVVGHSGIPVVNGSADVISDVILKYKDEEKNTIKISAFRLVVTTGSYKGTILVCEKDSGVVLELFSSKGEDTPFIQIFSTNLKLANPLEKTQKPSPISTEEKINFFLASLAFILSLILIYVANNIKTPLVNKKNEVFKNKKQKNNDKP